ncbi:MAG: hypothetical protein ACKO5M_02640 [Vulcanococcus sp.]
MKIGPVTLVGPLVDLDMMSIQAGQIALVRHINSDIVHFSVGRTIEVQTWIMQSLN